MEGRADIDGHTDCGVRWLGIVAEAPLRAAVEKQVGGGRGGYSIIIIIGYTPAFRAARKNWFSA